MGVGFIPTPKEDKETKIVTVDPETLKPVIFIIENREISYPDTRIEKLIPDAEPVFEIELRTEILKKLIEIVSKFSKSSFIKLSFYGLVKPVKFTVEGDEDDKVKMKGLFMPVIEK